MVYSDPRQPIFLRRLTVGAVRLLRGAAVAYLLILLTMTFIERWLVYPAPPVDEGDWSPQHLDYQDVNFVTQDGINLHGWFFEHPAPRRAVLYLHGNGEHVAHTADLMPLVAKKLHASVLLFDYRGYGHSGGKPHEKGLIVDGLAASAWLSERTGEPLDQLVLMGRSIGGGVAVALAERQGAGCLVLQNTFARLTDPAAQMFPWLPVRWLMRNQYPSIDRIRNYQGPVFCCHGERDTLVPIQQGKSLYLAAPSDQKQFVVHQPMGHNDPLPLAYWDRLAQFLDTLP